MRRPINRSRIETARGLFKQVQPGDPRAKRAFQDTVIDDGQITVIFLPESAQFFQVEFERKGRRDLMADR